MNKEQARQHVKSGLVRYLSQKGIDTRKPFRCLNPKHRDQNPSMSLDRKRNKAHCFSCGADYDTFDVVGIDYGLKNPRDIFQKAYELFDIAVGDSEAGVFRKGSAGFDLLAYYKVCQKRLSDTDYLQTRGISDAIARRFGVGFDPGYTRGTGGKTWRALVIPTGEGGYTVRNTDAKMAKGDRYRKHGSDPFFNLNALWEAQNPLFIVEGELDALSVMEVGADAVGLGSTASAPRFIKLVGKKKPTRPLILSLDNDEVGHKVSREIASGLERLGIPFSVANPYGSWKDANEALVRDRKAFAEAVDLALRGKVLESTVSTREAYFQNSAAACLSGFLKNCAESVNTPAVSTGFQKLDLVLDGGLYEGLYIIGAISSLGKTTLVTQIADQIAENGRYALIFSLEMSKNELIAKSLSRLTLVLAMAGGEIENAKTVRGITDRARYAEYSRAEREGIDAAIHAYAAYAERIFVSEGVGNIGVEKIREAVERHISVTGERPVVFVDYLQIVAPYSDRATDKQNVDKIVLELKRLSRDCKIPVIAVSSFNRANYREAVAMEAYKESGAIEYSSDVLIGLQLTGAGAQRFDATKRKRENPRKVELVVLKNRNGAVGDTIAFDYYPLFNYFREA